MSVSMTRKPEDDEFSNFQKVCSGQSLHRTAYLSAIEAIVVVVLHQKCFHPYEMGFKVRKSVSSGGLLLPQPLSLRICTLDTRQRPN